MNFNEFNKAFILRFSMEMVRFLLLPFGGFRVFETHWGLFPGLFGFGPGFFFLVALCCTSYELSDNFVLSSNNARFSFWFYVLFYITENECRINEHHV